VKRVAVFAALVLALAPSTFALKMGAEESPAGACAIACGVGDGAAGEHACCPVGSGKDQSPSWKACPAGPPVVPLPPQPATLESRATIGRPGGWSLLEAFASPSPLFGCTPPPDHIPLRLS